MTVLPIKTILIAGPTASGKSALALALAERLGGVVVNADSMQVYRELDILTARPGPADLSRAAHRLYGHVPGADAYSAGRFVREATAQIGAAHASGKLAIVTGGTGLYFKALTDGLSPIPDVPDDVRAYWRSEAQRLQAPMLHAELARRDPEMAARLAPGDSQRITRALEVLDASGRSLADWQREPGRAAIDPVTTAKFILRPERGDLRDRCDRRFDAMMEVGAVDEVQRLIQLGLSRDLPVMRALGVAPLIALIEGRLSREDAVARAKAETRQFAKRQDAWLRRYMIAWSKPSAQETESRASECFAFIQS